MPKRWWSEQRNTERSANPKPEGAAHPGFEGLGGRAVAASGIQQRAVNDRWEGEPRKPSSLLMPPSSCVSFNDAGLGYTITI